MATCSAPQPASLPGHQLIVDGRVEHPLRLTVDDLRRWPKVTEQLLLVCPGTFETRGDWSGAPLVEVLRRAGPRPGAARVRFTGADGYEQEIPLEQAQSDTMLLAYEVDGHALGPTEGAPVRIAAGNLPGFVWVQHLVRIEVR
jgi:DMSO/TMAO reductase YedYZ molybdopterin-dependent catalytic subunit